jgi:hypothetical protein
VLTRCDEKVGVGRQARDAQEVGLGPCVVAQSGADGGAVGQRLRVAGIPGQDVERSIAVPTPRVLPSGLKARSITMSGLISAGRDGRAVATSQRTTAWE